MMNAQKYTKTQSWSEVILHAWDSDLCSTATATVWSFTMMMWDPERRLYSTQTRMSAARIYNLRSETYSRRVVMETDESLVLDSCRC